MRVLIVDDDPVFLQSAARLLAPEAGFTVVGRAHNGAEALEQAERLCPDLVLMSVEMPGMDGLEATRRLKALPMAPKVLLVSIYDSEARRFSLASMAIHIAPVSRHGNSHLPMYPSAPADSASLRRASLS